jgi:hypothetical protein
MRLFQCDRCGQIVPFSAHRCQACDAELGYVTEHRSIRVLHPTADPAVFETDCCGLPLWRWSTCRARAASPAISMAS